MLPYEINPIGIVGTGVLDRPFFSRFRGWSGRPIPTHTELDCVKSNTPTNPNLFDKFFVYSYEQTKSTLVGALVIFDFAY